MPGCLLALDVGNTDITAGAFRAGRLLRQWRRPTNVSDSVEGLGNWLVSRRGPGSLRPTAVACASVVPAINGKLSRALSLRLGLRPRWIGPRSPLGLSFSVKKPGQVGADRVANALAAVSLFGAPSVVVDFGTATTFDCISRERAYLGGAILPGPRMAAWALAARTAKLPEVVVARPRRVVGRDTVECIQSGIYFGYLGMIEKVMELTLREMGEPRARRIYTGGLARLFKKDLGHGGVFEPDLTLQGIRIANEILAAGSRL